MKVEWISINKIIPYARNPRRNEGLPVAKVKASLKEFGWQQPIVVDKNMVIIVGHTRYLAAQELGAKEVPVHIADNLTATQAKAYRLADNKTGEFAAWDTELLKLEFDDLTIAGFDLDLTGFAADDYGVPDDGDTDNEEDRSDEPRKTMAERFGVPPFSVLSARDGWWQSRKQAWITMGIQSELGRGTDISLPPGAKDGGGGLLIDEYRRTGGGDLTWRIKDMNYYKKLARSPAVP